MGINISHGSNQWGEERHSATTIANLGKHLANVLPSGDWRQIANLFNGRFRGPEEVSPQRAGQVASILGRAARHRLMPSDWASDARLIGEAAGRAHRAREPWTWG
jgi:hypothetical protein